MTRLRSLSACHNRIASLPPGLWEATTLQHLHLSHNCLGAPPPNEEQQQQQQQLSRHYQQQQSSHQQEQQEAEQQRQEVEWGALPEGLGQLRHLQVRTVCYPVVLPAV